MRVESKRGIGPNCKSLQKFVVKVCERSVDHKNAITRWELMHFS